MSQVAIALIEDNVNAYTSINDLKKEIVKLMTKPLCNDTENLGYVDILSPAKIDFIVSNYLAIDMVYKKHYTIRELAQLEDETFKLLGNENNYYILHTVCNAEKISMRDWVSKPNSVDAIKRKLLKFHIQEFIIPKHINLSEYNENTLEQLPLEILERLLKNDVLKLQNYGEILQIAMTGNIEVLKEQISQSFLKESNNSISTEPLQSIIEPVNPSIDEGFTAETSILGGVEEHLNASLG